MIDQFYYKVYLPSIADYVHCKELYNHEYINILKFIKNKDDVCLGRYMEYLMSIKLIDTRPENLHRIDKLCILLTITAINIKPQIELVSTCEDTDQQYSLAVDIYDILNVISNVDYQPQGVTVGKDISINMQYPEDVLINTTELTAIDFISSITIDSGCYDFRKFSADQKIDICSSIVGDEASSMMPVINSMITKYKDIEFFSHFSPYIDDPVTYVYTFSLVDNSVIDFLKIIIGDDLNRFYELQHAMASNYRLSHEHYMNITPAETQLHYGYMRSDTEKKNVETEKLNQSNQESSEPTGPSIS